MAHSIGKTIAALRKERNWTQVELSEKLGISDKAVSKWESGNGFPEVSQFPALASIFDVSIDYLMTGTLPEKEVITISKVELCAKNDDPNIINNISFSSAKIRDGNGKSLINYVIQYKSYKVLKTMFDSCNHQSHYASLFDSCGFYSDELGVLEIVKLLLPIGGEVKYCFEVYKSIDIRKLNEFEHEFWRQGRYRKYTYLDVVKIYYEIFEYLVVNYESLSDEQRKFYFELEGNDGLDRNKCWSYAYPHLIDIAYDKNKALYNRIVKRIIAGNKYYSFNALKYEVIIVIMKYMVNIIY